MSTSAAEWLKYAIIFGLGPGPTPGGATISEVLAAEGFMVLAAALVGTTANLTATYSNGTAGVGATLTNSGTQAALVINGVTLAVGNRVLVKNQSSAFQNGVYSVTNIGSGSTNWVMTRVTDFNQASNILQYDVVYVSGGSVDFQKYYYLTTPSPVVVGTTSLTFAILNFFNIFQTGSGTVNRIPQLVFVSTDGQDVMGNGSYENPYLTLAYALSQITDSSDEKPYAICFTGVFEEVGEDFKIKPYINFLGSGLYASQIFLTGGDGISLDASIDGVNSTIRFANCTINNQVGDYVFDLNSSAMSGSTQYSVYVDTVSVFSDSGIRINKANGQQTLFLANNSQLSGADLTNGGQLYLMDSSSGGVVAVGTNVKNALVDIQGSVVDSLDITGSVTSGSADANVVNSIIATIERDGLARLTIDPISAARSTITGSGSTTLSPTALDTRAVLELVKSNDDPGYLVPMVYQTPQPTPSNFPIFLDALGSLYDAGVSLDVIVAYVCQKQGFARYTNVSLATVTNLTATYANGTAGVGRTLTNSGVLAPFFADGVFPPLNSRILVKDQATPAQNGVYYVSTVGDGVSVPWVLTGALDADSSGEIIYNKIVYVEGGDTLIGKIYRISNPSSPTMGTGSITFAILTVFDVFQKYSLFDMVTITNTTTLDASHWGKMIFFNNALPITITLPQQSTIPTTAGTYFYFCSVANVTNTVTFAVQGSDTLTGPTTCPSGSSGMFVRDRTTDWLNSLSVNSGVYALAGANSDITSLSGITGGVNSLANLTTTLTYSGDVFSDAAGENVAFGDIVYMKSDGKWWKSDADAAGLFPAQAMAVATILANATGVFLRSGFAKNNSWSWTVGGALYGSATAGVMTQTALTTTDSCTQPLGVAKAATIIQFNPSTVYITHV